MKSSLFSLFLVSQLFLYTDKCEGLRILGTFPFQGKSHFVMFEALMKGLADRGHHVDVISCYPQKKPYPNYRDIVVLPIKTPLVNNMTYEFAEKLRTSALEIVATLGGNDLCMHLTQPAIQKLIHEPPNDPPYDVVLMEVFGAHCYAIFGYLFNVPVVGVSSSGLYPWMNQILANPENYAIVPNLLWDYVPPHMNFWQRLCNTWTGIWARIKFNEKTKLQDTILQKYVSSDAPSVRELERNISLLLLNSHITLNGVRPITPAVVEVAGIHVQLDNDTKLSPVLQKWMDESTHGIVYMSFGSMVKIESFPRKILDIFYNSFAKLAPIRVLMKIASPDELPPGRPKNVFIQTWLPQSHVLRHKNVKAFITHGGLMGTQESIACGVPMIGIPIYADQYFNVDNYVRKNIAVKLDYDVMTEEDLDRALNAILWDPKYREASKKLAAKFLDRPQTPLETSEYWIKYVVKHGHDILRSPALDLAWWQVELLDVYAFILFATLTAIYIAMRLVGILTNIGLSMTMRSNMHCEKKKMS